MLSDPSDLAGIRRPPGPDLGAVKRGTPPGRGTSWTAVGLRHYAHCEVALQFCHGAPAWTIEPAADSYTARAFMVVGGVDGCHLQTRR